jgi:hypothetical protein
MCCWDAARRYPGDAFSVLRWWMLSVDGNWGMKVFRLDGMIHEKGGVNDDHGLVERAFCLAFVGAGGVSMNLCIVPDVGFAILMSRVEIES